MRLALLALALVAATPAAASDLVFMESCSACHQSEGQGAPGAFPALRGNPFVLGPPDAVIATVLNGRGGMPAFKDELTDQQLAEAISYIRGAWGNKAKPISVAEVAQARGGAAPKVKAALQAH